jgi:hypothetical protein
MKIDDVSQFLLVKSETIYWFVRRYKYSKSIGFITVYHNIKYLSMVIARKSKISATCPNTAVYICKMRETGKIPSE